MQRGGGFYQLEVSGPIHRVDPPPQGLLGPVVAMGYAPLFATSQNCRLRAFASSFPDLMSIAMDAFLFWDHMELYAFTPFPVIRHLFSKL